MYKEPRTITPASLGPYITQKQEHSLAQRPALQCASVTAETPSNIALNSKLHLVVAKREEISTADVFLGLAVTMTALTLLVPIIE